MNDEIREIREIRLPEAWNRIALGYFGYSDTGTELGTEPDRFGYRVVRFGFGNSVFRAQIDWRGHAWQDSICSSLRLSTLMNLYIHHLKEIFHPSHHKIYSFLASIRPLYHPLFTMGPTYHFI
jgi:hypothetical protein